MAMLFCRGGVILLVGKGSEGDVMKSAKEMNELSIVGAANAEKSQKDNVEMVINDIMTKVEKSARMGAFSMAYCILDSYVDGYKSSRVNGELVVFFYGMLKSRLVEAGYDVIMDSDRIVLKW